MLAHVYACEAVRNIQRLHRDLLDPELRRLPVREQLELQAARIWEAHQAGDAAVVPHITCWHPQLVGRTSEEIMGCLFTLTDARETMAREYGFADWADVESRGTGPPDVLFEAAVDALLNGDSEALRTLLQRHPDLVRQRSAFGHRATLLHYVGSNGVETYRQKVPSNLAEVAQLLLDAGADVNAAADMYGGQSTTLGLLLTSCHPAQAGVLEDVVRVLLAAGATHN